MAINVEEFYKQYGPMVLRRCTYLLRYDEEAHDAMQDVFVNLLRNETRLSDENPSSLLLRMATNECLNRIRSRKRRPEDGNDDLLQRIADATDDESKTGARQMLKRLFGEEKSSTAELAVMHLLDGFTLEETAEQVGLSVSGVRKRLRGLKSHLKELEQEVL